jgi:YbbR domain-containing protein
VSVRIFHNWLYKLAAFLVACVLWAAAQGFRSVEQSIDVPIAVEQVPEGVVVVDQSARELNVRVTGSRAALRRAEKELVRYPISLAGMKPGEARFNVDTDQFSLPRGARVSARSPSTLSFRLEARAQKKVPVRADLWGKPPAGYRVLEVRVTPEAVLLEGASSEVKKIRELTTDRIDVSELRGDAVRDVRLVIAASNVWRTDGSEPIRVDIRIEAPSPEPAVGPRGAAPLRPPARKGA